MFCVLERVVSGVLRAAFLMSFVQACFGNKLLEQYSTVVVELCSVCTNGRLVIRAGNRSKNSIEFTSVSAEPIIRSH